MKFTKWDYPVLGVLLMAVVRSTYIGDWASLCLLLGWIIARLQIGVLQAELKKYRDYWEAE